MHMTDPDRITAIVSGVVNNATPSNGQILSVGNAFTEAYTDAEILAITGTARASLSAAQKANLAVRYIRNFVIDTVKVAPHKSASRSIATTADGDISGL